ncbi:MAG: Holliday junction branch migration protein RuvA [Planctomycetota bacterium]|nr:Holliday junction branch migration protein RuvA [Planctomycetota bacterium]MDP6940576.1 Holliday junction branch migration protein RuvA [Planctomycetota bacterium]
MFDYLEGELESVEPGLTVMAVGGIGWSVQVSTRVSAQLAQGKKSRLYLHLAVSDSAFSLYGFLTKQERAIFRRLIQVTGVGPTSAIGLLSSLPPEELVAAVAEGDPIPLTAAKGIGRKTAERLILELRDHIEGLRKAAPGSTPSASADLARVLTELGFQDKMAQSVARKVCDELGFDTPFEELLRSALQKPSIK